MKILDSLDIGGSLYGLDVDPARNYAYVANYIDNKLHIVDISDPNNLKEVGSVRDDSLLQGALYPIFNAGYVYIEGAGGSFCVILVRDPAKPTIVGPTDECWMIGKKRMLSPARVIGTHSGFKAVRIVDVADPKEPVLVGEVVHASDLDSVLGIALKGNYAYVCGRNRFSVIDVKNPPSPSLEFTLNRPDKISWRTSDVEIYGNYALIADSENNAIDVIDIKDPVKPLFSHSFSDSKLNGLMDIEIVGDKAYCAGTLSNTFSIVDIADIANPAIVDFISDDEKLRRVMDIGVRGDYAYVTAGSRLTAVDIRLPTEDRCKDSTAHYPSGCDLLLNYDVDKDGVISTDENIAANMDALHDKITVKEYKIVYDCYVTYGGRINDMCPGCYTRGVKKRVTFLANVSDVKVVCR